MRHLHSYSLLSLTTLGLLATLVASGATAPALAADCGDGVAACRCGDRVVSNTTLDPSDPVTAAPCPCDDGINGLSVADGVALNLGGQTIRSGKDGLGRRACAVGILIEGDNVAVQGGKITGFLTGIATATTTTGSTLSELQFPENEIGIQIEASSTIVQKAVVQRNDLNCIVVTDGPAAQDKNVVQLNRCEDNGGAGVIVRGVMNTVARNVLLRNGSHGANIDGSADAISLNTSRYNGGEGFKIQGDDHTVTRNSAVSNDQDGYTVSCTGCHIERNTANYNGRPNVGWGILDGTSGTGTSHTANTYSSNGCTGNGRGDSSPAGLCK